MPLTARGSRNYGTPCTLWVTYMSGWSLTLQHCKKLIKYSQPFIIITVPNLGEIPKINASRITITPNSAVFQKEQTSYTSCLTSIILDTQNHRLIFTYTVFPLVRCIRDRKPAYVQGYRSRISAL